MWSLYNIHIPLKAPLPNDRAVKVLYRKVTDPDIPANYTVVYGSKMLRDGSLPGLVLTNLQDGVNYALRIEAKCCNETMYLVTSFPSENKVLPAIPATTTKARSRAIFQFFGEDPGNTAFTEAQLLGDAQLTVSDDYSTITFKPKPTDANKYLVIRYPAELGDFSRWYNSNLNNGSLPDSVFYEIQTVGSHKYIRSRVALALQENFSITFNQ